jgi:hypothetical protein
MEAKCSSKTMAKTCKTIAIQYYNPEHHNRQLHRRENYSFQIVSWNLHGGTEENHKNLSQGNQPPGRDFNPRHPDYDAGMLPTQP